MGSYNAEPSSSAFSAPAHHSVNSASVDYASMLKKVYLHHKETDEVIRSLGERHSRPFPANEQVTIINYRVDADNELTHYSSLHDEGMSTNACLPEARPSWTDAFQRNVERPDDSIVVRLILISKASCGYRSLFLWLINYLGWYLELEPGFFYLLLDVDGGFLLENSKPRGGALKATTLYLERHCFALCATKRKRMPAQSNWRPQISES